MHSTYQIARHTFLELLRHPIYSVSILIAQIPLAILPFLTIFSADNQVQLIYSMMGTMTLFCGMLVAIFTVGSSLVAEKKHGSIMVLMSKPIGLFSLLLGKILAVYPLFIIFTIITISTGALASLACDYSATINWSVSLTVIAIPILSWLLALLTNYLYNRPISSWSVIYNLMLIPLSYIIIRFMGEDFTSFKHIILFAGMICLAIILQATITVCTTALFRANIAFITATLLFTIGMLIPALQTVDIAVVNQFAEYLPVVIPDWSKFINIEILFNKTINFTNLKNLLLYQVALSAIYIIPTWLIFKRAEIGNFDRV